MLLRLVNRVKRIMKGKSGSFTIDSMLVLPLIILILTGLINISIAVFGKGNQALGKMKGSRAKMARIISERRGSATVFLCIFLTGLIVLLTVFCDIIGLFGGQEYFDDCTFSAAASAYTAYDNRLDEMYGIKGIKRMRLTALEKSLQQCFVNNIQTRQNSMYAIGDEELVVDEIETLKSEQMLKRQAIKAAGSALSEGLAKKLSKKCGKVDDAIATILQDASVMDKIKGVLAEDSSDEAGEKTDDKTDGKTSDKTDDKTGEKTISEAMLKNIIKNVLNKVLGEKVYDCVQQETVKDADFDAETAGNVLYRLGVKLFTEGGKQLAKLGEMVVLNEYIVRFFSHRLTPSLGQTPVHPEAEVEYVLTGEKTVKGRYKEIEAKLFLLRYALNAAYFLTSIEYIEKSLKYAKELSCGEPHVYAVLCVLIPVMWISAESNLDVSALSDGKKVPAVKSKLTWKTKSIAKAGIKLVLSRWFDGGAEGSEGSEGSDGSDGSEDSEKSEDLEASEELESSDDSNDKLGIGMEYIDYLRILLALEGEGKKLSRMSTVIAEGVGDELYNFVTRVNVCAKGSCDCFFTAGSWLPEKYTNEGSYLMRVKYPVDFSGGITGVE